MKNRYAKASQHVEDLMCLLSKSASAGGYRSRYGGEVNDFFCGDWDNQELVRKDLSEIEVDLEYVSAIGLWEDPWIMPGTEGLCGYEMIGEGDSAFPVLWCACGGDCEQPLVFVLYIGENGELRAYIPSDGNAYNHEKNAAYGIYDEIDYDDPSYVFDKKKLKVDVANRIVVKED